MDKEIVSALLQEIAEILEIKGENSFKIRAYYNAARAIENLTEDINKVVEEGRLEDIPGIGKGIASNIAEFAKEGHSEYYDELKASIPEGLLQMLQIPTLGPKKVKALYQQLKIKNLGELEYACNENRLVALEGFGSKTQQNILTGIAFIKKYQEQHLFSVAYSQANDVLAYLSKNKKIKQISLAGSIRRRKEVIKDIDIVASCTKKDVGPVMDYFTKIKGAQRVIAKGDTKSSIVLDSGISCDLRVVKAEQFPYALHHFTGSKEHNTAMRSMAKKKNMKMNEYGLFKNSRLIKCKSEEDIFSKMHLEFIEPELRENTGEIEAAGSGKLPELVSEKDIKGVLHVHSDYSDGTISIKEMALAAQNMGFKYIGICDHSQSAHYANGLSLERVKKQHDEIDRLNKKLDKIRILKGIEVDIMPDGRLDYSDKVLKKFELVIAAVHTKFGMSEKDMTKRIIRALKNPYVTMLAHPTGRLLLSREAYKVDLYRIIDASGEEGKIIELNGNPHRLDLDWRMCKYAKEKGVMISINPDAHKIDGLKDVYYGVGIARKGWLEKKDILNTRSLKELLKIFSGR